MTKKLVLPASVNEVSHHQTHGHIPGTKYVMPGGLTPRDGWSHPSRIGSELSFLQLEYDHTSQLQWREQLNTVWGSLPPNRVKTSKKYRSSIIEFIDFHAREQQKKQFGAHCRPPTLRPQFQSDFT